MNERTSERGSKYPLLQGGAQADVTLPQLRRCGGGSMKGVVKTNSLPLTGHRD
jgi:hypothetical protein